MIKIFHVYGVYANDDGGVSFLRHKNGGLVDDDEEENDYAQFLFETVSNQKEVV